jgi:hypothetical protein
MAFTADAAVMCVRNTQQNQALNSTLCTHKHHITQLNRYNSDKAHNRWARRKELSNTCPVQFQLLPTERPKLKGAVSPGTGFRLLTA